MRTLSRSSAVGSAFSPIIRFHTFWKGKLRWAFRHPLTADAPWSTVNRYLRWRIASRIARSSIIVPYVNDTKLLADAIMSAPSFDIFFGLGEFGDASFVLHFLTNEDLFGDVGANVGVYCILASGVRGAKSVAMEPVPTTIEALRLNMAINELGGLVDISRLASMPNLENSTSALTKVATTMSYRTGVGTVSAFSRSTTSSPHELPYSSRSMSKASKRT